VSPREQLTLLFLCTGNSARSQMAEAILNSRNDPRIRAGSAGTEPAERVNPLAVEELAERGIDWRAARPKTVDSVMDDHWDIIITVCDNARESCPMFPGRPAQAHWSVEDPAAVTGGTVERKRAFHQAAALLARRIDLLLALPFEKLRGLALSQELRRIAG
jgi:arsenate reductase